MRIIFFFLFPCLFQVFTNVVDPGDLVELLECKLCFFLYAVFQLLVANTSNMEPKDIKLF